MHFKHGGYYRVANNCWTRLDTEFAGAIQAWAAHEGADLVATTVAETCAAFLRDRADELAPKTLIGYKSSCKRIVEVFGHLQLDRVTRPDIANFLRLRTAGVSANRDKAFLSVVYSYAIEHGWAADNPCKGVRRRKEAPRRRVATPDEMRRLVALAPPVWKGLIMTGYLTGMREGELASLRRSQLTAGGIELDRSKTGAESLITWSAELRQAVLWGLMSCPRGWSAWVFPTKTGTRYTQSGLSSAWERLCERVGVVGLQFRDLRRTAATDAHSVLHASELLGHGSTAITKRVYRPRNTVAPVR